MTVLVVDDDQDIRLLMRVLLDERRFGPIWEASDGATALALARQHQPDLVVLDFRIPDVDGAAVIGGLHSAAPRARAVVLAGIDRPAPTWAHGGIETVALHRLGDDLN
ncbi:MAG: response regulator transcription factor [Actinomycetota bacterium]